MATVTLEAVRKVYADSGYVAVDGIDLAVRDGEFVVLVGPSGCGKSTTLRMIAGLESITSGRLRIGERVVNALPPKERDIAMVFQGYALYPHMTVFENMAFALRLRKRSRAEIKTQVERAATLLGLNDVLDRHPRQLSGGQRQRVAIGRAIVREPQVFLFDEPLSNLDAQLRADMRREIAALQRTLGATTIYVTHDQVEAMTLGQRIVILDAGRVQQIDTPLAIYERPANRFVGSFIGSPPMNLIDGEVTATGSGSGAHFTSIDGAVVMPLPTDRWALGLSGGQRQATIGIRPESITLVSIDADRSVGTPQATIAAGVLESIELLGYDAIAHVRVGHDVLSLRALPSTVPALGTPVALLADPSRVHLFDRVTGTAIDTQRGTGS